jgi:hypothetical protein
MVCVQKSAHPNGKYKYDVNYLSLRYSVACSYALINYKDTKTKCCHLKNRPVKGLSGKCLLEFRD